MLVGLILIAVVIGSVGYFIGSNFEDYRDYFKEVETKEYHE